MNTKKFLALVLALVMAFSLVVPASANTFGTIPPEPATLAGETSDDTARMTVYVTDKGENTPDSERTSVAAVGTIDKDMNATLKLNYGEYAANSEVTVYGQTKNNANLTTFSLGGTTSSACIAFTSENEANNPYFPGFSHLGNDGYDITFVDAMGEYSADWEYTFVKYDDSTSGVTLVLVPETGTSKEADARWQALKGEAFKETHNNPENSFINLIAGSYLQMDKEKLTVENDLLLDNFSNSENVNKNIESARENLTYIPLDSTSSNNVYQLLLKKGTQFSLGASIAEVKQDLLVTMTGVSKNYVGNILNDVYTNLESGSESGLAESLLEVFSDIVGLVDSGDGTNPVVITFGKPYTATNTTVDKDSGTTTDTSTAITVDTTLDDNETPTTTVNITTQVTTTTTGDNPGSNTTTTTKSVAVDTYIQAIVPVNPTYSTNNEAVIADATTAVNSLNTNEATFKAALEADGESSKENVLQTAAAANAIAEAAAKLTANQTGAVTAAKVVLKTELTNVTAAGSEVASVTYDIKPVAQLYSGDDVVAAVELKNKDIEDGQTFTFNIPVPASMTANEIKVFHNNEDIGNYEPVGTLGQVRYVTVTVSHFSLFELEPVDVSASDVAQVQANLSLEDDITINFLVYDLKYNASRYTVEYGFTDGKLYTENLNEVTPVSAGQYKIPVAHCAAKQMTDLVTFKLKFDGSYVDGKTTTDFSVQTYCVQAMNTYNSTVLHNLCKALLNYGTYAQYHFENYNVGNLASDIYQYGYNTGSIPEADEIPATVYYFDGTKPQNSSCEINLTLVDKTEMNFKFYLNDTEKFSVTKVEDLEENSSFTPSYKLSTSGNTCTVKVKGIPAKYLNHRIKLTYQYDSVEYSITFSPLSYVYLKRNQSSDGLGQLCRALYGYWAAANNHFINSKSN